MIRIVPSSQMDMLSLDGIYKALKYCVGHGWITELQQLMTLMSSSINIDKHFDDCDGDTLLHMAIGCGEVSSVEILLKQYKANPNITNNNNETTLNYAVQHKNLEIIKLLTKYEFDFAKLINVADFTEGHTVFHQMCRSHSIDIVKYVFEVCKNNTNCSINLLTQNRDGLSGLHWAIATQNIKFVRYLLENVYFPNNDTINENGTQCIRQYGGEFPLSMLAMMSKCNWEMFELLISYGMDLTQFHESKSNDIFYHLEFAMKHNNMNILERWYNYGIKHDKIANTREDHFQIVLLSSQYDLETFETTLAMILKREGINNIKDYENSKIITSDLLKQIVSLNTTITKVKRFVDSMMKKNYEFKCNDDIDSKWLDTATCTNGHEIDTTNNINKITIDGNKQCCVCNETCRNNLKPLIGFKCDQCKNIICDECTIVQLVSKKMNTFDDKTKHKNDYDREKYELSILEQLLQNKQNKKIIGKIATQCPNAMHLAWRYFHDHRIPKKESFLLLLANGADINCISTLARDKQGSLIHNVRDGTYMLSYLDILEANNFDFCKFINFKNSDGKTPLLVLCRSTYSWKMDQCFLEYVNRFVKIWQQHTNTTTTNTFETDNDGNNALHLLMMSEHPSNLQYILENVFFPNTDEINKIGLAAIKHQNTINGDTPLHLAMRIPNGEVAGECVKKLLKYNCDAVANKYNKSGHLPIHIACLNNNWHGLAVMMQNELYGRNNNVNLTTMTHDESKTDSKNYTALSISVSMEHHQCVKILCQNKNIQIDADMFYKSVQMNNTTILKCLIRTILRKDNIDSWKSMENCYHTKNKNAKNNNDSTIIIDTEFLEQLMTHATESASNDCAKVLHELTENGFKKQDYNYIALLLNYNLSSIKLDNNNHNIPNTNVVVNILDNDSFFLNKMRPGLNVVSKKKYININNDSEEKKQDVVGDHWIVDKELGKGAFGSVKLAINKNDNNDKVALKFIELKNNNIPTQFILGEIAIASQIYHNNVIMLREFNLNIFGNGSAVMMAFEYAPYGDLFNILKYNDYFSIDLAFYLFEQMVSAISACHSMNIIHRDLKPQNILIGHKFKIKIADFGLSKIVGKAKQENEKDYTVGTKGYMAPELYNDQKIDDSDIDNTSKNNSNSKNDSCSYDKACDIFSLSIIFWQMINGFKSMPFNSCKGSDPIYKLIVLKNYDLFWEHHNQNNTKFLENGYNTFNNNHLIQDLFLKMFEYEALKRITIQQIEKHEWIVEMHNHKNFQSSNVHDSALQGLCEVSQKYKVKNLASPRTNKDETSNNNKFNNSYNSNNSDMIGSGSSDICYSDGLPQNQSTVIISTLTDIEQHEVNGRTSTIANSNINSSNLERRNSIKSLLRKMSDRTSNYVATEIKSTTGK